jgi:anti-sigma regulatory factor (Ser/Thr protein kinase)
MRELALHILDIAQNSVSAQASTVYINVSELIKEDRLRLEIRDNGKGMDQEMVRAVTDPFFTSRTNRKVGLGIPLLKAAAEACEGWLKITSRPGKGTKVVVEFTRSHIDRMPLGNLADTILSLVIGSPEIHWIFTYRVDVEHFIFDNGLIKRQLEGIPLSDPHVISYIRNSLEEGITKLQLMGV